LSAIINLHDKATGNRLSSKPMMPAEWQARRHLDGNPWR